MNTPKLHPEEYYKSLNKIPFAVGGIFFDEEQKILLLKPTYQDGYLIPGGMAEANESPLDALKREIHEELGLTITQAKLLCVDYKTVQHMGGNPILQFVFVCDTITKATIKNIALSHEHSEFGFYSEEEAAQLVSSKLAKRLTALHVAIKSRSCFYLEDGDLPNSIINTI